ncbi:MAG: SGNH/GDSL hydrolase family protein [Sphingobacteriales bacterium]|nr:MAG: SGNH/GDSL hydrolase family protein [Sphingobacteriales bacterium]
MGNIYWGTPGALSAGANPSIIFLGDSWFWYPVGNLPLAIHTAFSEHDFLVVGRNGSEAAEWKDKHRKDIDGAFKFYGDAAQALVLSGGGNDVAGASDFLKIIKANCSKATTPQECYQPGQPESLLSSLFGHYKSVILKFRARNPQAPVILHNYDNAWPSGKGFLGPSDWLQVPMDMAKVPKALRRDLFKDLIEQLHGLHQALADDQAVGPVLALKTAGTLPEKPDGVASWWANELHPTPRGFRRIADQKFIPELKKTITT